LIAAASFAHWQLNPLLNLQDPIRARGPVRAEACLLWRLGIRLQTCLASSTPNEATCHFGSLAERVNHAMSWTDSAQHRESQWHPMIDRTFYLSKYYLHGER
jgi:hypothetical protein